MLWLALLACVPKASHVESSAAAAISEAEAAMIAAPPPPPVVEVQKLPDLPSARFDGDTIDPNAWRRKYNDAVRFQNAGDPTSAYKAATDAVGLALPDERGDALVMLAVNAVDAGARPIQVAAADAALDHPAAQWGPTQNAGARAHG